MSAISELNDANLRAELISLGFNAGPVTGTTRKLYEKKLENLRKSSKIRNTFSTKKIPSRIEKNASATVSAFVLPISAKKEKGPKITDTESSDNELDLTLPSNNSSTATRSSRDSITRK